MKPVGRRFQVLALAAVGMGLIWSAAHGEGPNGNVSLRETKNLSRSERTKLPEVPAPRATSMSLPMPRLARMSNAPPMLTHGDSAPAKKLASGEQIVTLLRSTPSPKLAAVEPQRHRDAEKKPAEVARRPEGAKTK